MKHRDALTFHLFLPEHPHSSVLHGALVVFMQVLGVGRSSDLYLWTLNSRPVTERDYMFLS